ncbi:MAG: TMEM43 family protein [Planctomycetia bacterium]|nr:TMEM43 family protein [Planctomycetia bacterium]
MAYTETTATSWFSRLGNAFKGILIGIVLVIIATALLFWNEGRLIKRYRALDQAEGECIEVSANVVNKVNEGALVYLTGSAKTDDVLSDPIFGVSTPAIHLVRRVEMYQWEETSSTSTTTQVGGGEKSETTYSYSKVWSASHIDSSAFKQSGHDNPATFPYEGQSFVAKNVRLGAFSLSPSLVGMIGPLEPYSVPEPSKVEPQNTDVIPVEPLPTQTTPADAESTESESTSDVASEETAPVETPAPEVPAPEAPVSEESASEEPAFRWENGGFYHGENSAAPQIGDVRVRFEYVPQTKEVSVVSEQHGETFVPHQTPNGTVELLENGLVSKEMMFANARSSNAILGWLLRAVGFVMMWIGFSMIFNPFKVLADVIPLLGNIVGFGVGMFSFLLAAIVSLVTIAIGWLYFRPIIAIPLLVLAGVLLLYTLLGGRAKRKV